MHKNMKKAARQVHHAAHHSYSVYHCNVVLKKAARQGNVRFDENLLADNKKARFEKERVQQVKSELNGPGG